MKYLYYPGCSLQGSAIHYDGSLRAIAPLLSIELEAIPDWLCCGATVMKSIDEGKSRSLAVRALVRADQRGMDLLMPCPSCANNHLQCLRWIISTQGGRREYGLRGTPRVKQVMEVLAFDLGPDRIQEKIQRKLVGLRVIPYYGCLTVRPFGLGGKESMENPQAMEGLIRATGAQPLFFPERVDCCGGGLLLTHEKMAARLTSAILRKAKEHGPDCMVVACPLCHFMLDGKQSVVEKEMGERIGLPILYSTQFLGLALGADSQTLGLNGLISPSREFMRKAMRSR